MTSAEDTMTNTMDYRTKSIAHEVKNVSVENAWPIAMDIGYSSVKCFSPIMICAFPFYAKNLGKNPQLFGEQEPYEILYRDGETGEVWRVGRSAQQMVNSKDTNDSQLELFARDRYDSPIFQIAARVGMAMCMLKNQAGEYNGRSIMLQTGLPPAYLTEDSPRIVSALAGHHKFSMKLWNNRNYVSFDFTVYEKNIHIMSQPMGTLRSISTDDNAKALMNAKKYYTSNILIFDAGFGTLDLYDIVNRKANSKETFAQFGMRAILEETGKRIGERSGVAIRSAAMQNALERGAFTITERKGVKISTKTEGFADLLEAATKEICEQAVEKVINMYNALDEYDYLILTGGTSAVWEPYIREYFQAIERLTVVMGNENCPDLDIIFCNVRGYYMYLIEWLRRKSIQK